jgi:ABC-type glycerol-3-phosphate transport system substrate-binding protein
VEWEEAPYAEALSKQMVELIAKTGSYDIFSISNNWVGAEAGTGQLLALDDLIAKAGPELDWQDFISKQRQMFVYTGKTYGIPLSSNIKMCAYRNDVFDQERIKVPPLGTSFTYSDWTNICKRLTKNGQKGTSFSTQPM